MTYPQKTLVSNAIGLWRMQQTQMLRRGNIACNRLFRCSTQDVQNSVLTGQTSFQSQFASHTDRLFAILRDDSQNAGKLAVASTHVFQNITHALQAGRKNPFTERTAVTQGARLALQHGKIMQRVTNGLVSFKNPHMLGYEPSGSIKTDMAGIRPALHTFVGIGAGYAVAVTVKVDEALSTDTNLLGYAAVKGKCRFDKKLPLFFKNSINALLSHLGMSCCFRIRDSAGAQMRIQIVK